MVIANIRQIHPIFSVTLDNTDVFYYIDIIGIEAENAVRACGFTVLFSVLFNAGFYGKIKKRARFNLPKNWSP